MTKAWPMPSVQPVTTAKNTYGELGGPCNFFILSIELTGPFAIFDRQVVLPRTDLGQDKQPESPHDVPGIGDDHLGGVEGADGDEDVPRRDKVFADLSPERPEAIWVEGGDPVGGGGHREL
jgi:hypothetical protein